MTPKETLRSLIRVLPLVPGGWEFVGLGVLGSEAAAMICSLGFRV